MTSLNEESVFAEALEIQDAQQRAAYLDRACADNPGLRNNVESLLSAYDAGQFLESPPVAPAATTEEPASERPGAVLGPYKLLEQIGEGGFGIVFMAEQQHPVRRKVALKVLKPGMDTRQVVARFEAERQALALMDHLNIAKILDAGETSSGRPYFVMDLVRGVPITDYCDQAQLSPRERLELFVSVCQAVQHAHHKGIIHRDLKPSNVMVTLHDGTAVVKVIDFGIAKALGQQLTDKTLFTGFAQLLGTPLYMSPEQAALSNIDVDTRSDIYSWGVLLYELLTGTTPFDKERLKEAGYDEMRRIIREEEPPRPSTRISTLGQAAATVSTQRKSDPKRLSQLIRGELDWIVMKALEKDRNRRYETANALAADVQRYLADEPVLAGPPSALYRFRKFARRHKGPVLAAFLILMALLTAVFSMAVGLAAVERERARTALERDEKSKALVAETRTREAEQQARDQAMAALRAMTDDIVENQMARGTQLTDENKEFLRKIIKHFEGFAAITANDAESRAVRAEGYCRVGVMRYRLGELKEAEGAYAVALAIRKQLAADFPTRPEFRHDLGVSHSNLGALLYSTGRLKEAETAYADALAIQKQLVADFPALPQFRQKLATSHNNLGLLLHDTGRLKEAETAYADALAIDKQLAADFPTRPGFRSELARTHNNLGVLLRDMGRLKEAEAAFADALAIQKQLAADFPTRPEFRSELARTHNNLGVLLRDMGRLTARPEFRRELAGSHHNLGNLLRNMGRLNEAEATYAYALAIQKQLAADFPDRPEFRHELAGSHCDLGKMLRDTGRLQKAEAAHADALAILKQLAADFPARRKFRQDLARIHTNLGNLLWDTGRLKEAQVVYGDALAIRKRLAVEFPNQPDMENDLAGTLVNVANLCNQRRDFAPAKAYLEEAQPHHQVALKANPQHPDRREFYRNNLWELTRANAGLLDQAGAVRAAARIRDLAWDPPANAYDAAFALARCIPIVEKHDHLDAAQRQAAVQFYGDRAMEILRYAVVKGFKDAPKMKKDTVLAPLRPREDFQKLLAELETKKQETEDRNHGLDQKPIPN
ncbi:MAG: serine/threonine protein kinase [Planctomycetes bacterium]|nr:serine/threonine protein kinase [Planctomycetota bacterium]